MQLDRLVQERGGKAADRGGEQHPLQRLAGPEPVGRIVAGRGQHGKLRPRLVAPGGQRRGRRGAPKVADGGRVTIGPGAERGGGHSVVTFGTDPVGKLDPMIKVLGQLTLGIGSDLQNPRCVGSVQRPEQSELGAGRPLQGHPHLIGDPLARERGPAGMPLPDASEQLTLSERGRAPAGELHGRHQRGFGLRVGK